MSIRKSKDKVNMSILNKIKSKKDILFSPFSKVKKEEKLRAWAEVTSHARALGLRGRIDTDTNYMRDVWWQNMKKLTMNLVEAAKQPDRGLQVARKWNHRDEAVLSILDQKPPSVVIGHTSGQTDQFDYELVPETTEPSQSKPSDPLNSRREDAESHVETPELSFREVKMELESDDERSREPDSDGEKSKTELEMELLRIKVYKARLEARQLELSLGLPRSVHTRRLPAPRRRPRLARRARATVVESEGSDDGFS